MIIGLFGSVGSGKTADGIKFIKMCYERGYKIYSNTGLNNIPFTPIDLDYLLDIVEVGHEVTQPELFFIDEIILFGLDSRNGGKVAKILSYLMLQNRKLSFDEHNKPTYFIYTTQYSDLIDNRLWKTSEVKINHFKIQTHRATYIFRYWYIKKNMRTHAYIDYFIGDNYFKYYDTKQIIKVAKTNRYEKNKKSIDLIKQKTLI